MSRRWMQGAAIFMLGKLQEEIGRITNNRKQQSSGFGKQITGKVGMAIGEAQDLVRSCLRRR
jgi:uncharacterized protein YjbJ (UPF0337 family)